MILSTEERASLYEIFSEIGMEKAGGEVGSAAIKINLARPPAKNQPRTDPYLITRVIEYLRSFSLRCTLIECADGYLQTNLKAIGLGDLLEEDDVEAIDLDMEEKIEEVSIGDEKHFFPECLKGFDLRIAIPSASKRPGMIFSNNIKLFTGIVPRRFYEAKKPVGWRPKIHIDLHKSVANIYLALRKYAPFHFSINGGLAMDEERGEFMIPEILVGDDALELDMHVVEKYFSIEMPEYIESLRRKK